MLVVVVTQFEVREARRQAVPTAHIHKPRSPAPPPLTNERLHTGEQHGTGGHGM